MFQKTTNQALTIRLLLYTLLACTSIGCSSLNSRRTEKSIKKQLHSQNFVRQHTGFLAIDLLSKDTVIRHNASKYFIPASTVKLFTFYTASQLLPDSIPSLKYSVEGKNVHVLGTGDPTWLHPYFKNEKPLNFLKQFDSVFLHLNNYAGEKLGPGWAWEDYAYYFSPEMNAIPLYGNVVTIMAGDSLTVFPHSFQSNMVRQDKKPLRDWKENRFSIPKECKDTLYIPYITSKRLTQQLLSHQIQKEVELLDALPMEKWDILPGISRDSVLKRILWESDNFLAEQLMLQSSSMLSDTLAFKKAKNFILEHHLNDIIQRPRWVDGSGLSRYNLFTPRSMVNLLQKLYMKTDSVKLFTLLPQWDLNGKLNEKEIKERPSFILAKSGSMGNVYNLCGYLKTRSGKLLAFSFMNNHFRRPSREVRQDMYDILTALHLSY